jgi:hypothetical protein
VQLNLTGHIIAGSMIASSKPVDNALNPAWRDTAIHMIVKASWEDDLPSSQVRRIHDRFTNKIGYAMRSISPDSGCYINEVSSNYPAQSQMPFLTYFSVINTSQIGNTPRLGQITPISELSRPNMILGTCYGAGSAWVVTSGSMSKKRVAFASEV